MTEIVVYHTALFFFVHDDDDYDGSDSFNDVSTRATRSHLGSNEKEGEREQRGTAAEWTRRRKEKGERNGPSNGATMGPSDYASRNTAKLAEM